jgi:hypothetical protein
MPVWCITSVAELCVANLNADCKLLRWEGKRQLLSLTVASLIISRLGETLTERV